MRKLIILGSLIAAAAAPTVASAQARCVNPQTNATTGVLVGAAGGAAVGSALAGRGSRGEGAILGAVGGALLGGAVGSSQTRCPDGYYRYDERSRQYYDNDGRVYAPGGPGYGPGPAAYRDQGPGYGPGPGPGPGPGGGFWQGAPGGIHERIDFLQQRIDRNVARGTVSRREADVAYRDLADIRREEARLRERDGGRLNPTDREYLQGRLDRAQQTLHWDRHY
jgi:hypothetical protein